MADDIDLHELLCKPDVIEYLNIFSGYDTLQGIRAFLTFILRTSGPEATQVTMAVIESSTNRFIGIGGLNQFDRNKKEADCFYALHPTVWNKGFGTELVQALTQIAKKQPKLKKLYAQVSPKNPASGKVAQKAGFQKKGLTKTQNLDEETIQYTYKLR